MKQIVIFSLVFLIVGCANTVQTASVAEAYKEFNAEDYEKALQLITQAENIKTTTPEMKAELTYLKAQSYEKLGYRRKATTLYEYLKEEHADSQYGYLAATALEEEL
ncbi:MAG: hypothetical protein JKY98_12470 [Gammaproteobacteria bacterium]|nr:hypothetical protein [Gammaproteobacteria bacterium]